MKIFKRITYLISLILLISFSNSCNNIPETYVYLGSQVPKDYIKEIKKLGLLNEGEKIKYFYSDGFTDIKEGIYFVTDKKLVAYNKEWETPEAIILFDDIVRLDVVYNDSFLEDSFITVESVDIILEFPVSSEKKRDKDFYNYLFKKANPTKRKN